MDSNPNAPRENVKDAESAGYDKANEGGSVAATGQQDKEAQGAGTFFALFVDHTPPPILIGTGSLLIEADVDFASRDNLGGASHTRRHKFAAGRPIKGLKILDDAGDTIYLNSAADGCSVKVWWDRSQAAEQIFVEGSTLTIEADRDMGSAATINHPKRKKRFTHPTAGATGIKQVEVIKGGRTRFFEDSDRLAQVMIWDTAD